MLYKKNDLVELVKDALPFHQGDMVRILEVNYDEDTYDICGPKGMELWVKDVPRQCLKGEVVDELV